MRRGAGLRRSTVWTLRRAASVALALSIVCAIGSLGVAVVTLLQWLIGGTTRLIAIGGLAVASVLMFFLFYETWSFAVRKDMEADAERGLAECGEDVGEGMV
jgi:membrane protein YdbS with pleckstrin-like domain